MTHTQKSLIRRVGVPIGLALLWAALAVRQPTVTYHLAPALVAAAVPATYGDQGGVRPSRRGSLLLAGAGVGVALVVTAVLSAVDALRGPSLLPVGGAALESAVFAVAGGLGRAVSALWPRSAPH